MKWLDSIFARWKRPEKAPQAEPQRYGARSYGHLTSAAKTAVTPERLVSIISAAENGDIVSQSELFEEMEKRDAELLGLIGQRKAGVLACKSEMLPGDEDDPRSVKAMEFCQEVMANIKTLMDANFDMLDAIPKGFSCLEVIWETSEKQWSPVGLEFKPQRWWAVDPADHNKLLLRDSKTWQGVEVNPLNFIEHRHRAMSGALTQSGLSLACSRPFVVRNYSLKDWLVMSELFGSPTRIGKLPQGASDADQQLMLDALKSLGHDAYGIIPSGAEIIFADAAGKSASADLYQKLMDVMGRWYAIAILGQVLTSGGEKGGSLALGRVQENVRFDLVDSDAKRFDRTWSGFYAVLTRLNFGADVLPPLHHTIVEEPKDLAGLANVVNVLAHAGARIPESWVHETFNIPEPVDDEPVLEPLQSPSPFGVPGMDGQAKSVSANALVSATVKKNGSAPSALSNAEGLWLRRLARSKPYLS